MTSCLGSRVKIYKRNLILSYRRNANVCEHLHKLVSYRRNADVGEHLDSVRAEGKMIFRKMDKGNHPGATVFLAERVCLRREPRIPGKM